MVYRLLDDSEEEILAADNPGKYLILEEHPGIPGHWLVQSLAPDFRFDLREVMGPGDIVSPAQLEDLVEACAGVYQIVFADDPCAILDAFEALNDPPEVELESGFPDTINGFLRFQVQGFNKLKRLDGGVAQWSTGTGKSVLAAGLTKYHEQLDHFDVCFYVVKAHNKVNAARGLLNLAGIESVILDGTQKQREKVYLELLDRLEAGERTVVITNYEKFRDDFCYIEKRVDKNGEPYEVICLQDWIAPVFESRLWVVWDEMPTKLKNRTSRLYQAVVKCLYKTNPPSTAWDRKRPSELRQIMLSATPIENDPEDWYNCVRILDPRIYGTVTEFRNKYVAYYDHFDPNKPKGWHRLPEMALRAVHIVHQVDKKHPDIASQFPKVIRDHRVLDWDPRDRRIYDKLTKELVKQVEEDEEGINILAAITVMQMLCNAPSLVNDSAALREAYEDAVATWVEAGGEEPKVRGSKGAVALLEALEGAKLTNDHHTKIAELRNVLLEEFPDEKFVIFTTLNRSIMPTLEELLQGWGITYVRYDGTTRQKQEAEDRFKSDPSIRVFLSSDKGSDSINLEVAANVLNYDGPLKWTTEEQRNNRIHRITSKFESVRFISLEMDNSIEVRKRRIRERKKGYHEGVFGGVIASEAISASTTKSDLIYILKG